jgi:glyoxylase-like metal-dependent hydrolase (beta-lactamase superfamily II)
MNEGDAGQESQTRPVHRIEFTVDWPPGHVAAYLVGGDEPVLFDAGMAGEAAEAELEAGFDEHGYELSDLEHLVITHPHVDHIGQVPTLLEAADPTLYAPAGVADRFQRDPDDLEAAVTRNATAAGLRGEYLEQAVDMSVESLERDSSLLPSDAVDHWVEPGETVDLGSLTVDAVHTPGHQADHLVYLDDSPDERRLFAGDMALGTFRPVAMHVGFDDGYEDAIDAYLTALDRLGALTVDRVLPGHDPVHTEFAEAVADDRESLDNLLRKTRTLLSDDPKTAVDLAFERSGSRDIRYLVIETTSALAKFDREGDANSEMEDGVRRFTQA